MNGESLSRPEAENRTVTILTHSYINGYEAGSERPFGGGLERYVHLLTGVVRELGLRPLVHQLAAEPFDLTYEGTRVRGYAYDFDRIGESFERMAEEGEGLLIYASCIWHPIRYRPGSIGICHGISWDRHDLPLAKKREIAETIGAAVNRLETLVSVDSHFQTYCRAACDFDDARKLILLPNPVDTAVFTPGGGRVRNREDRPLRVLFPRRFSYERGIVPMMLAANALLAEHPGIVFEFAGEMVEGSPVAAAFQIWLETHPHRGRIERRAYGFDEMVQAYRQADIAVIPTVYSEGTSLSCLEAMSCGLPVVATDVGGLNDILIDGFNGRLVPPRHEAIAGAVRELLADGRQRRSLGDAARRTAASFDLRRWKARWAEIIRAHL